MNRGLEVVNRSCFIGLCGVAGDLDFVSFFDGNPGVVAGVGEANKDAGVIGFISGEEFDFKAGIVEFLFAIPPKAHASLRGGDGIGGAKSARSGLLPF